MTLAEAMIMVIVAGSLMIPVIGTLQQGVERTGSLELRSALQNFAESKMAEITYYCLREGQIPTNSVEWMPYPNATSAEYKFSLRVEVLTDPALVDDNAVFTGHIHQDFTAVSLVASIAAAIGGAVPATETVSLMSMMCPPPPPPDYVYAAHPASQKIAIINPMVPDLITEIPVAPEVPMQLAVHPSGKYLAIKCPAKILMMDLVSHAFVQVYADTAFCGNNVAETGEGANGARQDRGLVFRPDGKYLYFTRHNPASVVIIKPTGTPTDPWNYSTHINLNSNLGHDMRLLDDGTLVVADGSSSNNRVYRINTHSNTLMETFAGGADPSTNTNVQLAMAGEWGGNNVFSRMGNNRVTKFNTHAPTDFITGQIGGSFDEFIDARSHSLLTSFDNRWLFAAAAYNSTGASTQRIAAFKVTNNTMELTTTTNSRLVTRGNTGGDSSRPISQMEYSPYREQLILKTTDNKLMFPSISALTSGSYSLVNDIAAVLTLNSGIADVKGRLAEYAWVICSDGVASHSIECIDIYSDVNTSLSDNIITLAQQPKGIGLNAGGNIGVYSFQQTGAAPKKLQAADHSVTNFPNALNFPALGRAAKTSFLLDGSLLVLTEKNDCSCHKTGGFFPGMNLTWNDMHNGFLLYEADSNGDPAATACLGFVARSESTGIGFRVRDLAVMHRRSGAYVLMSREDQTDSILLWIEKSRAPGYTPQTAAASYRIMGYWRTLFDGFPTRSARKLALSADDSILAIYDNQGNGSKQAVYFYDLTNNHFPTTAGLAYNRYKDGSVGSPLNAAVSNSYYDGQLNSNFSSTTTGNLFPGNILTASTTLDADAKFDAKYPAAFNWDVGSSDDIYYALTGYFYHETAANFMGFKSHDAGRLAKNGYYPYRTSANRQDWYDDASTDNYVAYDYLTGAGSGLVQFDMFSDDSGLGTVFGYSNLSTNFSAGNWGNVASPSAQMFRPFKFKPFLIHALKMDGEIASIHYSAANLGPTATDDLVICFSRDSAIPTLFFATTAAPALYAYDLYDEKFKKSDTNKLAENLTAHLVQINDMQISPDGFRLLIAGRDASNNGKVLIMNLACSPGTPGQLADAISWKVVTTENPPRAIAVRPFSGHSSIHDVYKSYTSGAPPYAGYGPHRAAVASGGIYLFGGALGVEEEANKDSIAKVTSGSGVQNITGATMTNKLKDFAAVTFDDDRILLFGGEAPGPEPQSSVSTFDINKKQFTQDAFAAMQPNDNSEKNKLRRHAAAATPYGPVILGGLKGDTTTSLVELDFSATWDAAPNTVMNDANKTLDPILELSSGNADPQHGSYFLNQHFAITGDTSFISSFKTIMKDKEGITFCVQNDPRGASALGNKNNDLGYSDGGALKITPSIALWIEAKTDDVDVCENGAHADYAGSGYVDFQTDFYSGSLGSTGVEKETWWWVVYDGQRNTLNVWVENETSGNTPPTGNPEAATWIIKDFSYDLTLLGSNAYFGFTGATNASSRYHRVRDWKLKIWEKGPYGAPIFDKGFDSFSSIPTNFSVFGSPTPTVNSGKIRLTGSSDYNRGSIWYDNAIAVDTLDSFRVAFTVCMWSNGENGMAFLIQGNGNTQAPTTTSSSLGYGSIGNSVAIEFDTYSSTGGDPNDNHVAIIKNGNATGSHDRYITPGWNIDDSSSRVNWVWVEYDKISNNLRVYMDGRNDGTVPNFPTDTPLVINHIFSAPLSTMIGGNQAWIGFVARCGNVSAQEHYVGSWKLEKSDLNATVGGITDEVKTYLPNTISGHFPDVAPLLTAQGDGFINEPDHIRLCDAAGSEKGAVWLTNPAAITNSSKFSSHFVVQFTDLSGTPADGMVFIVQGNGNTAITNDVGLGVGYKGIANSIGVELDFWANAWDASANDLSILSGGVHDSEHAEVPNPNGVTIVDSKEKHVWVDFDGTTNILKAYISYSHIKPATPQATYDFDSVPTTLTGLLGGTNAWFGFGSATGAEYSITRIRAWELVVDNKTLIQFPPRGETLATTNLPAAMVNGTAVTHYSRKDGKYYLYYIGGGTDYGTQVADMIWRFNFDDATWSKKDVATSTSTKININFAGPNSASQVNTRTQVAACSWGDEIFIFGGAYSNSPTTYAIAYNPDTGRYRNIAGLSTARVSMSAVPYGPYIFLIGGSTAYNGTTGAGNVILRYKP